MHRQADDRPIIGPVAAPDLHCMTLNLRRSVPRPTGHPDSWEHRRDAVVALVASEEPTVLAVQEALRPQAVDLATGIGSRWEAVLLGRDRFGDGEAVGLLVDTERCTVVERRSWAMSRTPLRPGSRSWATAFPPARGRRRPRRPRDRTTVPGTGHAPRRRIALGPTPLGATARPDRRPVRPARRRDGRLQRAGRVGTVASTGGGRASRTPGGEPPVWRRRNSARTPPTGSRAPTSRASTACSPPRTPSCPAPRSRHGGPGGVWPSDHLAVHAVLSFQATA
ncbi:hypothetical protein [Curtobacterium sp. MCPF17_052]|uniref:hypothetical protein n=1 Tax=Curtobacterium sp. MCPF17_052 TaxID=2175655 RepID=UPI0024E0297A|nr:hypothetical protein [Curtobacterium sp. MCPF17_052]WIB12240.1 hypothetical protein DEJ36_16210 [Curtobacterium sp. MCPF17_052]